MSNWAPYDIQSSHCLVLHHFPSLLVLFASHALSTFLQNYVVGLSYTPVVLDTFSSHTHNLKWQSTLPNKTSFSYLRATDSHPPRNPSICRKVLKAWARHTNWMKYWYGRYFFYMQKVHPRKFHIWTIRYVENHPVSDSQVARFHETELSV